MVGTIGLRTAGFDTKINAYVKHNVVIVFLLINARSIGVNEGGTR